SGPESGRHGGDNLSGDQTREVERIGGEGEDERRENVGVEEEPRDEDGNGCDPRGERSHGHDGQRREDRKAEDDRKKEIPLENRRDAEREKRVENEEEMMIGLQPVARVWAGGERAGRPWVINGPEIHGDDERRQAGGDSNLNEAGFG